MDAIAFPDLQHDTPFRLYPPTLPYAPVVLTSPHSGRRFFPDLMINVRLDEEKLRRSEDCYVDELFGAAPQFGATLLTANFPRVLCDANREPWELDPAMFSDPLPDWVNTSSVRVGAGLGTIARLAATGDPIYAAKLPFAEAERRIAAYWRPFHDALARWVNDVRARFGYCLIIDCHSMPASAQARRGTSYVADFVLGDLHGASCSPRVTRTVEEALISRGFRVRRNDPYAGGFITRHYGKPAEDVHVLQIEIARSLYMDEESYERLRSFGHIRRRMGEVIQTITVQAHTLLA